MSEAMMLATAVANLSTFKEDKKGNLEELQFIPLSSL